MRIVFLSMLSLPAWLFLSGCTTFTTGVANSPSARGTRYVPVGTPMPHGGGTGIESQDIVSMTDKMVRDMLASPVLVKRKTPAVVIVDDKYFVNDSSQRINKRLIVDRLRNELFRAAKGRITFIARHDDQMVRDEQAKRANGSVAGTPVTKLPTAEYRLAGRFQNLQGTDQHGDRTNYVQVLFEMVDLNTDQLVWSGMYEFKKAGTEGIMYQ